MKVFTNAERKTLLAACLVAPPKAAVPGWYRYSLVVYTRAPADHEWRVESSESVGAISDTRIQSRVRAAASARAGRLGLSDDPRTSAGIDSTGAWWAAQAVVANDAGHDVVLACIFPDLVWGTHFPETRGPFVAVVHWPPGANNDIHSLCRVRAVCLGADAWDHLDAAAAEFRARCAAPGEAHDLEFAASTAARGTPLCARGANVYLCVTMDHGVEEGTWSAEPLAALLADPAMRALVCASK